MRGIAVAILLDQLGTPLTLTSLASFSSHVIELFVANNYPFAFCRVLSVTGTCFLCNGGFIGGILALRVFPLNWSACLALVVLSSIVHYFL